LGGAEQDGPAPLAGTGRQLHRGRRLVIIAAVVLGLSALVETQQRVLIASAAALDHLRVGWLLAAVVAEILSMTSLGRMQRHLLRNAGVRLTARTAVAIVYASNAISATVPLAGPELGTAFAFRQYRRRGAGKIGTAWMLTVSGVISSVTFGAVVAFSALASDNTAAVLAGITGTIALVAVSAVLVLSLRREALRDRLKALATRAVQAVQRVRHQPTGQTGAMIDAAIDEVSAFRPRRGDWFWIVCAASINWIADALCLALALRALGLNLPWPVIGLVWAAGESVGTLRLTPGGLGTVEAAMAAALVATGLGPEVAMTSILAYRLVSFWMVVAIGWGIQLATPATGLVSRSDPAQSPGVRSALPVCAGA
jgi:putative heme transporter